MIICNLCNLSVTFFESLHSEEHDCINDNLTTFIDNVDNLSSLFFLLCKHISILKSRASTLTVIRFLFSFSSFWFEDDCTSFLLKKCENVEKFFSQLNPLLFRRLKLSLKIRCMIFFRNFTELKTLKLNDEMLGFLEFYKFAVKERSESSKMTRWI